MAFPLLSNNFLSGTPGNDMSTMGISPQALNFTGGAGASQIPSGYFPGQVDQASNWLSGLPDVKSGGLNFGMNIPTAQLALGGVNSLANLWGGLQAQKLAKDQFNFTKNMANTNLANQTQSYNTALTDRINARAKTQGMSQQEAQSYIDQNRLPASRV